MEMEDDYLSEDNDDPSDGNYQGDGGEQNMDAEPCNIQYEEGSQEDGSEEDEAAHSYELRLAARQVRPIMTNIIDWDESGDYDPSEKRPPRTPDRRSKPKRQREDGEESPTKRLRSARQLSPSKARQLGADWVVTLQLQSAAGKELLSRYPDNWPEEHDSFFHDSHVIAPPANHDDDSPTKRCMRPRRRLVHYGTPFWDDHSLPVITDPTGEQDDLRNHPAARGCVRCREVGEVCDLRKPGAVWPCVQCSEHYKDAGGHIPCELVAPPERKQECEPCQDQELECSYAVEEGEEVQDDHVAPCRQCAASGERCIAGPHKDAIRVRATYSPPPGVRYHAYRAYISCTDCRRRKKYCSLRSKEDEPPCVSCEVAGIDCTFERIVPVPKTAPSHAEIESIAPEVKTAPSNAAVESVAPKAKTTPSHVTVESVVPVAKVVSNAEDATQVPDKAEPLKRDQKPSMPFVAMMVDIKQPERGPSPKSCKAPTQNEEFHSVWPLKMSSAEREIAMTAMFDRLCNGKPAPSDKWCSICVAPASVECCRSRPGCSLKLCDSCHQELMHCGAGGLQQLLRQRMWSEKAVTELRADACFLESEGVLCKSVYENANKQRSKAS
ncbi:uncharacterized protein J3D65DRAFT_6906 [Phyllosticta citribraziliensis]|uniref:Zn(2)-C6 fungal-type domain-containing protein n=1 Tax=Phyllosticta citribraziliensis TaxID=989973 RepID=A0ABR1M8B6_9PEZI